jgi:hypothetical protein
MNSELNDVISYTAWCRPNLASEQPLTVILNDNHSGFDTIRNVLTFQFFIASSKQQVNGEVLGAIYQ